MISFLISMFDEEWTVNRNILEISKIFPDSFIAVVQSESGTTVEGSDDVSILPNLAKTLKRHEVPAAALCRNFSLLFQKAKQESEYIVVLTGDTLVTGATNFDRRWEDMKRGGKVLACSQAIGQDFHAVDSDPGNGKCGGRFQFFGISDFMPQFWMVGGDFFRATGAFKDIANTNKYTSEQCLGDEFMRHVKGEFRNNALVLADNAYAYSDGIKFHIRRDPLI